MCYMVYISTDCSEDLSRRNSELVRFAKPSAANSSPCPSTLKHEHKWFLGSKSECSCTFRHLYHESVELGFGAPVEWFPEERDEIEATRQIYGILKELVERGHQVELLDCWSGDEESEAIPLDVSLSQVTADEFRFFERHLFSLSR